MKNKSVFTQVMLLILLALLCITITVALAIFVGSLDISMFNLKNINYSNAIPVLIIGGFISCVIVGVAVLFTCRSVFTKLKNYFIDENNKELTI